ncbi:ferric reductase-like transmembrane domain-containing protein [Leifsonia shinshuensis]|uniref:ferric reductase-like transmembrane domain-containing protein n=1 Tax=Leifsonia shinshuensis TaxID=150026 RepID=UPI001F513A7F|nr:ferric reductase-like transmembrane domain-containing protein [Leifsonia shinshuensis]MCI0158976.1 ferric reductase-like transmembrane domain-containing protein [Leifsonia shinshuensis]
MSELLWAAGRASGLIALALFTVSVLLGIVIRSGRPLPGLPRFSVSLIHRNVSLLACVFLALHVGTLLFDSYAKLSLLDVVVPFAGAFKPFWQGLGTVAFDLVVAIVITGLLRRRIGQRAFRFVHWFTYAMWPIALTHAIGNGTNGTSRWFLLLSAASTALVAGAVIWRLSSRFVEHSRARRVATGYTSGPMTRHDDTR